MSHAMSYRSAGSTLTRFQTCALCLFAAGWVAVLILLPMLQSERPGDAWASSGLLLGLSIGVAVLLSVRAATSEASNGFPTVLAMALVVGSAAYFAQIVGVIAHSPGVPIFVVTGLAVLGCFCGGIAVLLALGSATLTPSIAAARQCRSAA